MCPHYARVFSLLIAAALLPLTASARILNVPDDFQTIQTGIDSASAGDTVLVSPGVYRETPNLPDRSITLASTFLLTNDSTAIDSTIIDGEGLRRCITAESDGGNRSQVIGFTLRNGRSAYGGGIYVNSASPILSHLRIRDCIADRCGGGIYVTNGSAVSLSHAVLDRDSAGAFGGGLMVYDTSSVSAEEIVISNCEASNYGSATHISRGSDIRLTRFELYGNRNSYCTMSIIDSGLEAEFGTIHNDESGSVIHGEGAPRIGLTNIGMWQNIVSSSLLITTSGQTEIQNSTIVTDQAGCFLGHLRNTTIHNSIIRGFDAIVPLDEHPNTDVTVSYSDISGGLDAFRFCRSVLNQRGIINADPEFVGAEAGDYRLRFTSPCIDTGDPDSPRDADRTISDIGSQPINQWYRLLAPLSPDTVMEDCGPVNLLDLDSIISERNGGWITFGLNAPEELCAFIDRNNQLSIEPLPNFAGSSQPIIIYASNGFDTASSCLSLTVLSVSDPPGPFALLEPANGTVVMADLRNRYSWQASVDPDIGDSIRYLFHFSAGEMERPYTMVTYSQSVFFALRHMPADTTELTGYWWVEATCRGDTVQCDSVFSLTIRAGDQAAPFDDDLPIAFDFSAPFPNPFNSSTTIKYSLAAAGWTEVDVLDVNGRIVCELTRERVSPGRHEVVWNAEGVPAGVYLVRLRAGEMKAVQKVVLIR